MRPKTCTIAILLAVIFPFIHTPLCHSVAILDSKYEIYRLFGDYDIPMYVINCFKQWSPQDQSLSCRAEDDVMQCLERYISDEEALRCFRTNGLCASLLDCLSRKRPPELHFPRARYRIAVFSYEDPNNTGLANDFSTLISHEILLNSHVKSLGVLNYKSTLTPDSPYEPALFDKVDLLTKDQDVAMSVWGIIQKVEDKLLIDTFVQLSPSSLEKYFTWKFRLPGPMNTQELVASLRPDRIHVQRLRIPVDSKKDIQKAAKSLRQLRNSPGSDGLVTYEISVGKVYSLLQRRENWGQLLFDDGKKGWIPLNGHCAGQCAPLLEAARFSIGLLNHMIGKPKKHADMKLTLEANAVDDQIEAFGEKNIRPLTEVSDAASKIATKWVGSFDMTPPIGAAFANILAISKLSQEAKKSYSNLCGQGKSPQEAYERVEFSKEKVLQIAYELADSTLYDPYNIDVLQNLSLLFSYVGDSKRANIAQQLVKDRGTEQNH